MTDGPEVVCHRRPDTMGRVLAAHYADRPLSQLPRWAVERYASRWRRRPDVYYVEARTESGDFLGFIFGHTLGERPWKTLFSDPPALTPVGALVLAENRLRGYLSRSRDRQDGETDEAAEGNERFEPLPDGLLGSVPYLKAEYMMVDTRWRGLRVARHLYSALENEVRATGIAMMSSTIATQNVASVKAILRSGFDVYRQSPSTFRTIKMLREDNRP